jgi:peptidyl-prolyl cis-trans isomerase B (cyclophilin B)
MKKILSLLSLVILLTSNPAFSQKNNQTDKKATMEKVYYVQITTDFGTMKVKLYNETPLHRDNFVKLVSEGFYDSLLFHRVIKGFMIQGGDPQSKNASAGQMLGSGDVGYRIPAEFNDSLYHKKGVLAAARDNNP